MSQTEVPFTAFPIYRAELASALGFDDADLATNRAGQLGALERRTQNRQLLITASGTFGVLVFGVLCLGLAAVFAFVGGVLLNGVLAFLASLVGFGYFGRFGLRLWLDLRDGAVLSTEGFVKPTSSETRILGRSAWTYYWTVDDVERFAVRKAWGVLMPARHRIYYLPRSRTVVAAEPIA